MRFILGYTSHAKIRLLMVRIFFLMLFTSFMYVPLRGCAAHSDFPQSALRLGWAFYVTIQLFTYAAFSLSEAASPLNVHVTQHMSRFTQHAYSPRNLNGIYTELGAYGTMLSVGQCMVL